MTEFNNEENVGEHVSKDHFEDDRVVEETEVVEVKHDITTTTTHDHDDNDHDHETHLLDLDDNGNDENDDHLDNDDQYHDNDALKQSTSTDHLSKKKRLYDDNNVADSSSFNESNASAAKRHHASDDDHLDNDKLQPPPPPPPQNQRIGFAGMTHAHPPLPPPTVTTYSANPSAHSPAIGPRYSQHQLAPGNGSAAAPSSQNHNHPPSHPNDKPVRVRMLVSTKDAGVIIGHKGVHVTEIKDMIGILVRVSPQIPNVPERIVTLSGPLHGVGRAVAFLAQKLMDKWDLVQRESGGAGPSSSRPPLEFLTLRILVPACKMGFLIGKGGATIKDLQKSSGATISSDDSNLPNSTERVVTIKGDAEALQIASYTIASMVGLEDEVANMPPQILYDPGFRVASGMPMMAPPMMGGGHASSRGGGGGGDWRGGGGRSVHSDYRPNRSQQPPHHQQSYGSPAAGANPMHPGGGGGYPMMMDPSTMTADQKAAMNAYYLQMQQMQMMLAQNPQMAQQYQQYYAQMMTGGGGGQMMAPPGRSGGSMGGGGGGNYVTDEMRVPHEYVGKIIGRGGANTKEIKFRTGSDIKINDHADGESDRVCVIYGTAEGNKHAMDMIREKIAFLRSVPARDMSRPGGGGGGGAGRRN